MVCDKVWLKIVDIKLFLVLAFASHFEIMTDLMYHTWLSSTSKGCQMRAWNEKV